MATGLFNLKQVNQAISQGAWSGYIAPRWVEYLCVAGGGGGAGSYTNGIGPGGGAGGLLTGIVTVAAGASYSVTVGAGGTAGSASSTSAQTNGVNSVFGSISATGGGYGAANLAPSSGGSGGGGAAASASTTAGASGVAGQGNSGGTATLTANYGCGGGGGAGTKGLDGTTSVSGNGGAGIASAITGTVVTYAGGGGASGFTSLTAGTGGVGGGGAGSFGTAGASGSSNTGGGGGGAGYSGGHFAGGAGGSGIVVVRYPGNVQFYTGGTVNYNNGYIIHIFTSNGTLAPTTPAPYSTSYQISRSLRFNSADSAYLDRAQTTGSTQKATWSGWVKRSALTIGAFSTLFSAGTSNTDTLAWNNTGDTLRFFLNGASSADLVTTQVFRDPSAWYHIVIAIDTTQATAANRILMYINGVQVTAFTTATYPTQNYTFTRLNTSGYSANLGSIGTGSFLSAYMTEVNFVDGQQLAATSFGATSTTTGIWSPIQYTGTYGTNGFYVNFSDNSNTTAATLGKDYSGNGNNWTPNNFSVTAGAGNDSLVDSPTSYGTDTGVGGSVRGNYATLNPVEGITGTVTYSNGNLQVVWGGSSAASAIVGTIGVSSGKWYWEVTPVGTLANLIGIANANSSPNSVKAAPNAGGYYYYDVGQRYTPTSSGGAYGASYTTGDVIGIALDMDVGTVTMYKNNVSQGVMDSSLSGLTIQPALQSATSGSGVEMICNFGQRPFAYTAPSGFKALCTQNLTTPTIGATSNTLATQFFAPVLWTGNDANPRTITGVGFQPDWVWVKKRSAGGNNFLQDAVRGVTSTDTRSLVSNNTDAETNFYPANGGVTAFASDGFTTSGGSANANLNESGVTYVAWNWRAGNNAGASNSSGSITSTVSVNTTSGFSVVTYTGNGGANQSIGHGLGVIPGMVIIKNRTSGTAHWLVHHQSQPTGYTLYLDLTNAQDSGTSQWGTSAQTSTLFYVGYTSGATGSNNSGDAYVAYCFAPIAGYSAFGSYTGNGSADGPFVFTGMRPAFILIKNTSATGYWVIFDVARNTYNAMTSQLWPNGNDAESNTYGVIDAVSNGFKLRNTAAGYNDNGATYIYMALASNPFKYSLAR